MKIKIEAALEGKDITEFFVNKLKENKIDVDIGQIKFFVTNKQGQEVEISEDKIKVSYIKE